MEGYVQNTNPNWTHIFKQGLSPNSTISLDDLYVLYGEKNHLEVGDEFVKWLRDVKLKGRTDCKLVYTFDEDTSGAPSTQEPPVNTDIVPMPTTDDAVTQITKLTVLKAKEVIPTLSDLSSLKAASQQARQMPNKDTLCRLIDKRIQELQQYAKH